MSRSKSLSSTVADPDPAVMPHVAMIRREYVPFEPTVLGAL